ncbi:peptidoglycan DD-metalloendopeptidase family protein [Halopseudomonas sp. SMJS2]|uniref:murein hydrolase activator EnvC family protein n=1 Tax=Halopseudomonas sp. SMJS2 TaxID=3041098 RepID=UPI0004501998|nr:peptidoglycan DD-metalloendopeptidase family protein [Halopseudomonas sp. SMJS2]EZQ19482.1 peptidase M23 [Halopseudomonas bauzanensis]WGK61357.1 peptidoglycan DD-metalloendopeptidase family protein [Halopseudomonas sp. SMJS2]
MGMRSWAGLLLCLMLLPALPAAAQPADAEKARAELKQAEQEIVRLKKLLGSIRQEASGLEKELQNSESEIGRLRRESGELEQQIREGESRLQDLQQQAEALQVALEAQQDQIARQVRAAYMAGQQDYLKMVLNQDDPSRVARMLRYYGYVSRARVEEIERYSDTIEQIREASAQIASQQTALQQDRQALAARQGELEAEREKRSQVLAGLRERSQSQQQQITRRESERAELAALIKKLDEAITSIPAPAGSLPFAQAKGKLPMPVSGPIRARFGSQRGADSRLKWDGLLIGAREGAQVHAVHGGRVVFADWLRGSGLLLILDHGNGYLSLYGHNQSLLRDVGSWVQPGEAIATVGNSGGLGEAALYFSIRHRGQALDPAAWCMLSS